MMLYFDSVNQYDGVPCAAMFGKFDGLHVGHRTLLAEMERTCGPLRKMIFVLDIPSDPMREELYTKEEKRLLCEAAGFDGYLHISFSDELKNLSPEAFLRDVLHDKCRVSKLYVGAGWRFGRDRLGDTAFLAEFAPKYGIEAHIIPENSEKGTPVSSTELRSLIRKGETAMAATLLGTPFFVAGTTERGRQLGRTLNFPTLNLYPPVRKMLPPAGVYVSVTRIGSAAYPSVTNIGVNPTVCERNPVSVETHLLPETAPDPLPDYNTDIIVCFGPRIRPERKFPSLRALSEQISKDVTYAREHPLDSRAVVSPTISSGLPKQ